MEVNSDGTLTKLFEPLDPADVARSDWQYSLRRHPRRRDLENRRRVGSAVRQIPLRVRDGAHVARRHTFRKIRLRYIIHTGMKHTAVKLTE